MRERQEEREKEGGELEEMTEERTEEGTEERIEDREEGLEVYWGSLRRRWEVWGRCRVPLSSQESQGLCYIHWQPRKCHCWVCEGAPRAVQQGAWMLPRQTEEGRLSGQKSLQNWSSSPWCQKVVWVTENSLLKALPATVWPSPKGDDQETVLGLPADRFP